MVSIKILLLRVTPYLTLFAVGLQFGKPNPVNWPPPPYDAECQSAQGYKSAAWRSCQRNCAKSLSLCRSKRNTLTASPPSCATSIKHLRAVYPAYDSKEPLYWIWEGSRSDVRVWSMPSTRFLSCLAIRAWYFPQFQFRLKALKGELPGVNKASWWSERWVSYIYFVLSIQWYFTEIPCVNLCRYKLQLQLRRAKSVNIPFKIYEGPDCSLVSGITNSGSPLSRLQRFVVFKTGISIKKLCVVSVEFKESSCPAYLYFRINFSPISQLPWASTSSPWMMIDERRSIKQSINSNRSALNWWVSRKEAASEFRTSMENHAVPQFWMENGIDHTFC